MSEHTNQPEENPAHQSSSVFRIFGFAIFGFAFMVLAVFILVYVMYLNRRSDPTEIEQDPSKASKEYFWSKPTDAEIPKGEKGEMIKYGKELIANTSTYLGPNGSVMHNTNALNCQNCHLDAGTKTFGNSYADVASTYPLYRARSGKIATIERRINDCILRSLNGKDTLTADSKELQAMTAYIKWLGKDVPKGVKPFGSELEKLPFLSRAADPKEGEKIFMEKCTTCHGENGQGQLNEDGETYLYPPLWGELTYNDGAGLYRLDKFASYVKNNMPLGATYDKPQLTDEEAWDLAAFVNSKIHPHKDQQKDYPNLKEKPITTPFGPYADSFSEKQHKLGPFKPISKYYEKLEKKK